jgi:2-dehydro-3-deoxygalactonokinase
MDAAALIAVDWGTTSARASLVAHDGRVLATRQAQLGIQSVRDGRFAEALDALLGDWRSLPLRRIASGMIGSRQGWIEAPYVECPASLDALATRLVTTPGGELVIVPGLLARNEDGLPDVMRGEETQLVGAVADDESVLAVLPGTHSKWAHVAGRELRGFATFMTGEFYAVLLAHSILGRLAQPVSAADAPAAGFDRGVAQGLGPGALSHLAFGARTLGLTGGLEARDVADWLSGLLIGHEIRHAREWAHARGLPSERVRVIGTDALVARYAVALAAAGIVAEPGAPDAAVRGLMRIAGHAGWNVETTA